MPLGEVGRCYHCKTYGSIDELVLHRGIWEYICKDGEACLRRRRTPAVDTKWVGHTSGFVSLKKRQPRRDV